MASKWAIRTNHLKRSHKKNMLKIGVNLAPWNINRVVPPLPMIQVEIQHPKNILWKKNPGGDEAAFWAGGEPKEKSTSKQKHQETEQAVEILGTPRLPSSLRCISRIWNPNLHLPLESWVGGRSNIWTTSGCCKTLSNHLLPRVF